MSRIRSSVTYDEAGEIVVGEYLKLVFPLPSPLPSPSSLSGAYLSNSAYAPFISSYDFCLIFLSLPSGKFHFVRSDSFEKKNCKKERITELCKKFPSAVGGIDSKSSFSWAIKWRNGLIKAQLESELTQFKQRNTKKTLAREKNKRGRVNRLWDSFGPLSNKFNESSKRWYWQITWGGDLLEAKEWNVANEIRQGHP